MSWKNTFLLFVAAGFFAIAVLTQGCSKKECVDCVDSKGNLFTFCDPPEPGIDSLSCGDIYKD